MNTYLNQNNVFGEQPEDQEGEYYRPKPILNPLVKVLILIIALLVVALVLWIKGCFKPFDKEAAYQELIERVCEASITYASDPKNQADLEGITTPGKIVYLKVGELVDNHLIGPELMDYRNDRKIPLTTDIRLAVIVDESIMCEGFAWPEDDQVPPILYLVGDAVIHVAKGANFIDPGYYAVDYRDGEVTKKVSRSGHLDTNISGTYHLYYDVKDRAGNPATQVQRTVIVQ